ncbi:Metalloreductase STEAP2 [Portunus trituberculatus]|uniref:Metalloreductase STEAP2 n=1 Tax=Portunus trituberculatus TaxID=210409 RepID=A0A5B7F3A5_PORTR|nr:Metalloreductase STEAP2 [Portunus trituberculatus]
MFITFIVGVSSLPSVGATLTWREFNFIQSKLGWVALLTAVMHDGLLGWGFSADDYAVCSLPSGAQNRTSPFSSIPPTPLPAPASLGDWGIEDFRGEPKEARYDDPKKKSKDRFGE